MRICCCSSDVCSSPLISIEPLQVQLQNGDGGIQGIATVSALFQEFTVGSVQITGGDQRYSYESECLAAGKKLDAGERCNVIVKFNESGAAGSSAAQQTARSEEHTSELQSLMRISYAVLRLKKKITSTKQ